MIRIYSLVVLLLFTTVTQSTNSRTIMVSIKPFYNITAAVMLGVGKPELLISQDSSPHDFHLRPSDAELISNSDLIIWGGNILEPYLEKPLASLASTNIDLSQTSGLNLLPMRVDPNWHDHADHDHHHDHEAYDPHFWLDPENSIVMAARIAEGLSELHPEHAQTYRQNAKQFANDIRQKESLWKERLKPYQLSPYIVGHDAYQYFNAYFQLDEVGAITLNPELPPSARHMKELQKMIKSTNVTCIFNEPQFSNKIAESLIAGTDVQISTLDPLGRDKDLGPNGYFSLIENLVKSFVECNQKN